MKTDEKEFTNTENQNINGNCGGCFTDADGAAGASAYDNLADAGGAADNVSCEMPDVAETAPETAAEVTPEPTPEEEAAMWRDKFVRLSAEYDNYRKRTLKEKMDIIAAGGEDVVRAMLDVLDDVDRALAAITAASDVEAVKQGISLIDAKLRGTLKARGLAEIEAVGQALDADLHEAVARIPAPSDEQRGKIIDVVQKGYKLKDKIIRYPKVVVGQ